MAVQLQTEGPGVVPDATKDPPSAGSVLAGKICGSESPVVGRQQFTMDVVSGEYFPRLSEPYQNCGGGNGWCCRLSSKGRNPTPAIVKWASILRSNIPLCLKPYMGIGLKVVEGSNNNNERRIYDLKNCRYWKESTL